jgi:hypothetical protein
MLRRSHILTTAALVAVCATPASAATDEELRSGGAAASGDVAPPPSSIAASATDEYQDLRSPDAVDAAEHRGLYEPMPAERGPYVLERDYGSPDAADAARDLPPVQIPAPVVAAGEPSGGFDWGDAGIGAAAMLALFSIAAGSALLLSGRRRRRGVRVATH